MVMRMLGPLRALADVKDVEGFTVADDRVLLVLSVLLLAFVIELMRAVASFSLIVSRP